MLVESIQKIFVAFAQGIWSALSYNLEDIRRNPFFYAVILVWFPTCFKVFWIEANIDQDVLHCHQ